VLAASTRRSNCSPDPSPSGSPQKPQEQIHSQSDSFQPKIRRFQLTYSFFEAKVPPSNSFKSLFSADLSFVAVHAHWESACEPFSPVTDTCE